MDVHALERESGTIVRARAMPPDAPVTISYRMASRAKMQRADNRPVRGDLKRL
jgi:hypothetical protein